LHPICTYHGATNSAFLIFDTVDRASPNLLAGFLNDCIKPDFKTGLDYCYT